MFRSLINTFRFVGLFFLWAILGAASYLLVTSFFPTDHEITSSHGVSSNHPIPIIRDRELEAATVLFAQSENPVDLAFDHAGTGYLLDESGKITRIAPTVENPESDANETTEYFDLANEKTDEAIPFTTLIFHPAYLNEESKGFGRFYAIIPEKAGAGEVDFRPEFAVSSEHHQDVLVEFKTTTPGAVTFEGERREMLRLSQPGIEHNMAGLAFDHRGNLFVAIGDGAESKIGKNSPSRNAMSLSNPYGKVLRIDPLGDNSKNGQYGLPKRNPLAVIDSAIPEIWCYGLRAPHGLQFDPFREWLCIGDTGKENLEEVNVSEYGGEHFGWDLCEGSFFFPPSEGSRPTEGVTAPHVEFGRKSDKVVGGFVYRGERFPILAGKIIVATTTGRLLAAKAQPDESAGELKLISDPNIAEDSDEEPLMASVNAIRPGPGGEIFILTSEGNVFELHKPVNAATSKRHRKPLLVMDAKLISRSDSI
ncbi:MAG: PQQ-dependent sugar dehydrogenase [Verrucomicrobiales bacterium]